MELPSLSHHGGKDGFKMTLSPEPGLPSSSLGPSPARPLTRWGVSKQEREELNPSVPSRHALLPLPLWACLEAWGPEPLPCRPLSAC